MKRMHLVELEDLPWMPAVMRDGGRDALDVAFARLGFYRGLAADFATWLGAGQERRLVDVCSGSGGGALTMLTELRALGVRDVTLTLTDLYPNPDLQHRVQALGDATVRALPSPVDALHTPRDLAGVRTMFSALHHFQPPQVQALLADAVAAHAPVAFFDVAAAPPLRQMPAFLAPLLSIPNAVMLFLASLVLMPLVRPVRPLALVCTYLIPLIPFLFMWDGTVSALRAYLPDELLALAQTVPGGETYEWRAGRSGNALYLFGRKRLP